MTDRTSPRRSEVCFVIYFVQSLLIFENLGGAKHAKSKHNVHMKIVDDKLRIIDDVPSSAVELSVKEKVSKLYIDTTLRI